MIDEFAKEHLHDHLRWVREALVWKLGGLCEYDIRRPLTATGTNLLGLVKHLAVWESRYFGEVFARPFPQPLPRWDDEAADDAALLGELCDLVNRAYAAGEEGLWRPGAWRATA